MSPLDLPVSVLLALWAPVPSSFGLTVVQGPDAIHEVADEGPGGVGVLSLGSWLAQAGPLRRCAAVLPSPGHPLPGLSSVLEAGEGVLIEVGLTSSSDTPAGVGESEDLGRLAGLSGPTDLGRRAVPGGRADLSGPAHLGGPAGLRKILLVPHPSGASVRWRAEEISAVVPPFDASHARRATHQATEEAIAALTELDLARERPDLAEELTDLVTAVLDPRLVPPRLDPRRRDLLERALRLAAICELALSDDGAAATLAQAERRRQVLRPLLEVARQSVAAATESWGQAV